MNRSDAALSSLMPARVRNRREARGMSGADLARRVGVSPAYISQIEKGVRVPDVPVAARLAVALEDDEPLYVAWSRDHKARSRSPDHTAGDEDAWSRLYRSDRFEDERSFGRAVSSGADIPISRGRSAEVAPAGPSERFVTREMARDLVETGPSLVTAPVLAPGKDPGEREEVPRALQVDEVRIDPRMLPGAGAGGGAAAGTRAGLGAGAALALGRPFVFRADEQVSRRVRDRVSPGDLVIVSRDLAEGAPEPGRLYALRSGGKVFLGRLVRFGDQFLVQPGPGETEMLDLGLTAGGPAKPAVVGEIVAVVKGG